MMTTRALTSVADSHFHGFTPEGVAISDWFPDYPGRVPLLGYLTTDVATVGREIAAADTVLDYFDILCQ